MKLVIEDNGQFERINSNLEKVVAALSVLTETIEKAAGKGAIPLNAETSLPAEAASAAAATVEATQQVTEAVKQAAEVEPNGEGHAIVEAAEQEVKNQSGHINNDSIEYVKSPEGKIYRVPKGEVYPTGCTSAWERVTREAYMKQQEAAEQQPAAPAQPQQPAQPAPAQPAPAAPAQPQYMEPSQFAQQVVAWYSAAPEQAAERGTFLTQLNARYGIGHLGELAPEYQQQYMMELNNFGK